MTKKRDKYYIEFDEAVGLKELGFKEECDFYFDVFGKIRIDERGTFNFNQSEDCWSRPTYQQALNFFREYYKLHGVVISWTEGGKVVWYFSNEPVGKPCIYRGYVCTAASHEEAQYELIKDLIKKCKNPTN